MKISLQDWTHFKRCWCFSYSDLYALLLFLGDSLIYRMRQHKATLPFPTHLLQMSNPSLNLIHSHLDNDSHPVKVCITYQVVLGSCCLKAVVWTKLFPHTVNILLMEVKAVPFFFCLEKWRQE